MPGMDGLSLQRHLVATGRHIPIVFVTGYPDTELRDKAMSLGAVCFLTKPFNEAPSQRDGSGDKSQFRDVSSRRVRAAIYTNVYGCSAAMRVGSAKCGAGYPHGRSG